MKTRELFPIVMMIGGAFSALAQTAVVTKPTPIAATAPTAVPALVPYSAMAEGNDGRPITGEVSATFLLFKDESRGEPLWTETQLITLDATGHYTAQLGASSPSGLPLEIFGTGTARWLEVQIAGQKPQPRTLLMTVPYAAKPQTPRPSAACPRLPSRSPGQPQMPQSRMPPLSRLMPDRPSRPLAAPVTTCRNSPAPAPLPTRRSTTTERRLASATFQIRARS